MIFNKKVRLWWCKEFKDGIENFGDGLSPYIVKNVSGKEVYRASLGKRSFQFGKINFAIGSILNKVTPNSNVWGSGIMNHYDFVHNANFYAVRGPRSRKRLLELGYKVPEVYGDPGLLLPTFFNPIVQKEYEYGIIPHHVDYDLVKNFVISNDILVINLLDPIEKVVEDILKCNKTISSSLHGVIVSHAYNVPSLWCTFSNKISGDGIKYIDYYESIGLKSVNQIFFDTEDLATLSSGKLNLLFLQNERHVLPAIYLDRMLKELIMNKPF